MSRQLLRFAAAPVWSLGQLCSLALLGWAMTLSLGTVAAVFACVGVAALRGCGPWEGGALRQVLLPVVALLACVVARHPSLGRRIEHGPFGPGRSP
ncbi:MAG: hypothetical protein ACI8QZ_001458 [Chlamydiales bacterium]|jgi:hypothetical protein